MDLKHLKEIVIFMKNNNVYTFSYEGLNVVFSNQIATMPTDITAAINHNLTDEDLYGYDMPKDSGYEGVLDELVTQTNNK